MLGSLGLRAHSIKRSTRCGRYDPNASVRLRNRRTLATSQSGRLSGQPGSGDLPTLHEPLDHRPTTDGPDTLSACRLLVCSACTLKAAPPSLLAHIKPKSLLETAVMRSDTAFVIMLAASLAACSPASDEAPPAEAGGVAT